MCFYTYIADVREVPVTSDNSLQLCHIPGSVQETFPVAKFIASYIASC